MKISSPPIALPGRIRTVVFDLDGTLVDSYEAIRESLNHARLRFGRTALSLDQVRRGVGHGLEVLIAEHVGEDRISEGVRLFRERYAEVFAGRTRALPGAVQALERLSEAGIPIAVASNKPARFSRPILEALGMAGFVSAVHGPDTVGATKPDPAMLRRCLQDLDGRPDSSIYVGDMVLDVESGERAQLAVILVTGGSADRESLAHTGRSVFESLDDVADAILLRS